MLANNETGVQAPLARLIDAVHEVGALFHTDATQAIGRVPVDLTALGVDLASFSAHKIYGPKGIGVLYVLRGTKLVPLVHGGGHEGGMRSGTLNVPSIVGFGRAAELASKLLQSESDRQSRLVEHLLNNLSARIKGIELNGAAARRLPNTANIRIRGTDGEAVMANAPSVLVSSGSACTSMVPAPSHVLTAMGMDATAAEESLRISVGRPTTTTEIDDAVELLSDAIGRVRDFEGVIIS
jgi:cysteine desulfurase